MVVLAVGASLTACGGGDDPAPVASTTAVAAPETVAPGAPLADGIGLSIDPVSGVTTTPWETASVSFGCDGWTGRIVTGALDRTIDVALWGPECIVSEGLNGQRVQYRSISDVESGEIVEARDVSVGTATAIADVYIECTNDCTEYEDRIVLVELDAPPDERFPGVMISTLDDVPFDELFAVAEALRSGASG